MVRRGLGWEVLTLLWSELGASPITNPKKGFINMDCFPQGALYAPLPQGNSGNACNSRNKQTNRRNNQTKNAIEAANRLPWSNRTACGTANYSTTSSTMGIVLLLVSYYCNYWHNTATTGFRLLLLAYFFYYSINAMQLIKMQWRQMNEKDATKKDAAKIDATIRWLAPQSGALRISAYRDFQSIPNPYPIHL